MKEGTTAASTVLIVDDEPDLCDMLTFEFETRGYRAFSALDGRGALEVLHGVSIGVIISDLRMPFLNGLELLDCLKDRNVEKPVMVLMSAYTDIGLNEAHARGAEAFFSKPFRLADMANTVQFLQKPLRERWAKPPDDMPGKCLRVSILDLPAGVSSRVFDLGRGGACIAAGDTVPVTGQRIGFDISLAQGPFTHLAGTGIVRWIEADASREWPDRCGVEFEYLAGDCIEPVTAWLEQHRKKPYIPNFHIQ